MSGLKLKYILIFICTFQYLLLLNLSAQSYKIDASDASYELLSGHLNMGNPGPVGKKIFANNKYLTLNEKPIIPVMGEFHFSRCNQDDWEDILLKMKANGIRIIATYVFWIHHEEEQGVFDWSGNKNLRAFVELCRKYDLWIYPRIGPWCHGEVRNGGLPDWIVSQHEFEIRKNIPKYQFYAERWYKEIASQLEGLYYKDNGPIIGIQLENEYWRGKKGEEHILWLKKTAQKYGMDVPLYTVTGWRNASVPANEVIPLWGGYPAAPWNTNIEKIENNNSFHFCKPVNDESIGHKSSGDQYKPDYSNYPYFTCELGVGNQISEHRRPVISPSDGAAILTASLASGSNLPGYYVFAGGLNPTGKFTTLEEDRIESGYWNEYPDISYDFQAAIKETGEISPSYHKLKVIHYFLNEFGTLLAPMKPFIYENKNTSDDLQLAFRCNEKTGFLFVSNYSRGQKKSIKKNVRFSVQLKNEEISLPSKNIQIQDSSLFIWPVNLSIGKTVLKYATSQLICNLNRGDTTDWYFFESEGISPEYQFSDINIKEIIVNNISLEESDNRYLISSIIPGLEAPVIVHELNNTIHRIYTLSKKQAEQFWYFNNNDSEYAFISDANLIFTGKELIASSNSTNNEIIALNCNLTSEHVSFQTAKTNSAFMRTKIQHNSEKIECEFQKSDLIELATWLKLSADEYNKSKILYHKLFFKNFTISDPSKIRKATLYLLTDENCKIRANGQWVNQQIHPLHANKLDLTGYINNGQNKLMFDFQLQSNEKSFAGFLEIEHYNAKKEYISTDTSWQYIEQYKIPAPWENAQDLKQVISVNKPKQYEKIKFSPDRYIIPIDTNSIKQYKNMYLKIKYSGDKAQCFLNKELVADNFNNETIWSINLSNLEFKTNSDLVIELKPFQQNPLIYFDKMPDINNTEITSIWIEREYTSIFIPNRAGAFRLKQ